MELSDFIAATISEIMIGVSRAAKAHSSPDLGGYINPVRASRQNEYEHLPIRDVEFDVAVTVEEGSDSKRGGGLSIKVIEADLSSNTLKKVTGESRVKFVVPVSMPATRIVDL